MKTVYDKNGNQVKIIEQADVGTYTNVYNSGVNVYYDEATVTVVFNKVISHIDGGSVSNEGIISLPNGILSKHGSWNTCGLLNSAWVPIDKQIYFSYSAGSNKINLRSQSDLDNVVLVGSFTYPRSLFTIA